MIRSAPLAMARKTPESPRMGSASGRKPCSGNPFHRVFPLMASVESSRGFLFVWSPARRGRVTTARRAGKAELVRDRGEIPHIPVAKLSPVPDKAGGCRFRNGSD